MSVIDYDKVAQVYDSVREGDPVIISRMLTEKQLDENSSVLEIGCGTGNNTVLISKVSSAKVYGMDQSAGMLEKAMAKHSDIEYSQGDAVTLKGFADNQFDLVYMVDVIHHIKNIDIMFENIARILKEEGRVFVFTNSHEQIRSSRLTSRYFPETIEAELKRYQDGCEIEAAMKKAGLKNILTEEILHPPVEDIGSRLIALAETKGYSMFHLISQDAIDRGIAKLKEDMDKGQVTYYPKSLMVAGTK
ncbi:MAG: class I SAM-dependent methyltransferase [Bacillota bacterium]